MSSHTNQNVDIHDEENYDPTVWVPKTHSHGTKDIWGRFWILLGLTIVDVGFYFVMAPGMLRNIIFIVLGIVKAWFIVGTFMHMKHEKKSLASMIILPMIVIIFFLIWMMYEGNFWGTFK
ncbi:cytochrome C oxidase subunit IV family protein [Bacteroidia bacterium]|nr:cytochrome C oxidase subunit IV family protein [Bacteroidia bacterium]MDC1395228.1 cytochrome C oxidase subunit IV family protein [Bacteroidia bacterium]